jgi:DNA-binding transcriptional LysR family regulator
MSAGSRPGLDWNDVRFFLAVAREGTLARAGLVLAVDQTTVGRRIAALEERLSASLFDRSTGRFVLTDAGRRMVLSAERMEEAALELPAHAAADGERCAGTVRIATTEALAERFVIPAIRDVQARHPAVNVVIATAWARVDLRRGDADLAVRMIRPTDPRLALRKLADMSLRLYASDDYVARCGVPQSLAGHPLIGYEDALRSGHAFTNLTTDGGRPALQTNSGRVLVAAAIAGIGIAQLSSFIGDAIPQLVPVLPMLDKPYSVWLVLPQAKRRVPAIRVVSEAIVASFKRHQGGSSLASESTAGASEGPSEQPAVDARQPKGVRSRRRVNPRRSTTAR